mmetsp:Transcript_92928/g.277333  ORF Transcript_92928/g.277333 Transcript_92928/m.277333 type:complete len:81 (+) Transcript_92928:408-650(+)
MPSQATSKPQAPSRMPPGATPKLSKALTPRPPPGAAPGPPSEAPEPGCLDVAVGATEVPTKALRTRGEPLSRGACPSDCC